tara:strand:- start:93 stop:359 length:267 start_codon:yes stop_codon:yes gene_type:complete
MRLAHYIYFTNNVGAMVSFHHEVIGLKVLSPPKDMDYDKEGWVQLGNKNFEVGIHRASMEGSQGRNRNKLVFVVDDVAETRERLAAQN